MQLVKMRNRLSVVGIVPTPYRPTFAALSTYVPSGRFRGLCCIYETFITTEGSIEFYSFAVNRGSLMFAVLGSDMNENGLQTQDRMCDIARTEALITLYYKKVPYITVYSLKKFKNDHSVHLANHIRIGLITSG